MNCSTIVSRFATATLPSIGMLTLLVAIAPGAARAQLALDFTGELDNAFQSDIILGWSFELEDPFLVDGLGFFDNFNSDGAGLQQEHEVSIWTDAIGGERHAQTTITNASAAVVSTAANGRWLFNPITPVLLQPGQYVIGARDPSCDGVDCDRIRLQATSIATAPGITFLENRDSGTEDFPPGSDFPLQANAYFGPTFSGVRVPEPSTAILLAVAVLIGCVVRLRKE